MFKFLKDKLKGAISKASEKIEEEGQVEEQEVEKTPEPEQKAPEPVEQSTKDTSEDFEEEPDESKAEPDERPSEEKPGEGKREEEKPSEEEKSEPASVTEETPAPVETALEEPSEVQEPEKKKRFQFSSWFRKKKEDAEEASEEPKEQPKEEVAHEKPAEPVETDVKPQEAVAAGPSVSEPAGEDTELTEEAKEEPVASEPQPSEVEPQREEDTTKEASVEAEEESTPEVTSEPKADREEARAEAQVAEAEEPETAPEPAAEEPKPTEEPKPEPETGPKREQETEEEPKKRGFFGAIKERIVTTKINEKQFEDMFFELEMAMLENNVAVEVIDKIKHDLQESLVDQPIRRNKIAETVADSLKDSIKRLFEEGFDVLSKIGQKQDKPYVIAFFGINGSGKTTSIAKVTSMLKEKGHSVVIAAADTFRAAAIDQLGLHAEKLGVKLIKHDYGSDPAAVAFDAIKHAQAKKVDVVLVDTAGRMHQNANLMDEMKKIVRVAEPDLKIFVGESITGNDCVEQAKAFNDAIGIDGIILSKADIDEKGGAAVSVSYVTKKPILYLGTGQEYKDLTKFDTEVVMQNLGLA